ncbi:MAG: hypothetical protein OEW48_17795, partial [Phycisphaerae bacterium]|nr:hypothetical protein [Phycisphaerae bacterium]
SAPSAERETQPSEPVRAARTPARPAPVIEEEGPIPKPPAPIPNQAARPVRVTTPQSPSSRPPTRKDIVRQIPPVDPHKDSVILVEAFMVEVKLSSLHSQGVPQISEGNDYVTADHIIKLMKTTDGAVLTAGAKLAVGQNSKAETKSRTRQSILSGEPENKRREYVEVGTTFTAFATIRAGQKIFSEIGFEHSSIEKGDGMTDTGVLVEREWTSSVYVQAGEPTLVGAIADKETGTFLIVTANIQK